MEKSDFKEWLKKEAEKESLKIKVSFTDDDYTGKARKGEIKIPENLFGDILTSEEQKALGAHEISHLKYRHEERESKWLTKKVLFWSAVLLLITLPLTYAFEFSRLDERVPTSIIIGAFGVIGVRIFLQLLDLKKLHEWEADEYAAKKVGAAPSISYFQKSEAIVEEWRKKGLRWRATIWYRKKTHPSKSERIERLEKMF